MQILRAEAMSNQSEGQWSMDIFQNAPPSIRWTGVLKLHPTGGGPGREVYRKSGFVSQRAAEEGCERFIERRKARG